MYLHARVRKRVAARVCVSGWMWQAHTAQGRQQFGAALTGTRTGARTCMCGVRLIGLAVPDHTHMRLPRTRAGTRARTGRINHTCCRTRARSMHGFWDGYSIATRVDNVGRSA